MDSVTAVQTAVVFVWLGMVLAISFLETPLKFRAPGITVPLGVGIGRLVFRALNRVEMVFAVVLIACAAIDPRPSTVWLTAAACVALALGALLLRPLMDRRVARGRVGEGGRRSSMHLWYVLLELVKVAVLVWLGVVLLGP